MSLRSSRAAPRPQGSFSVQGCPAQVLGSVSVPWLCCSLPSWEQGLHGQCWVWGFLTQGFEESGECELMLLGHVSLLVPMVSQPSLMVLSGCRHATGKAQHGNFLVAIKQEKGESARVGGEKPEEEVSARACVPSRTIPAPKCPAWCCPCHSARPAPAHVWPWAREGLRLCLEGCMARVSLGAAPVSP